jgi:hypothetical protein
MIGKRRQKSSSVSGSEFATLPARPPQMTLTASSLPADHEYVRNEISDMAHQLENERNLIGDATTKTLLKEMWLIPGNRRRTIITIMLMIWQQMTGVNAIVRRFQPFSNQCFGTDTPLPRTTTPLKSSRPSA